MKMIITKFFAKHRPILTALWIIYGLFVTWTIFTNVSEFAFDISPTIRADVSTLTSIILVIIGTIYAAYDLLGGSNGPLRWITLMLTYAVIGALGISQFIGLIVGVYLAFSPQPHFTDFAEIAVYSLLVGLLAGIFGGILIALRRLSVGSNRKKVASIAISGATGGIIGTIIVFLFNIPYAIDVHRLVFPIALCGGGAMILQAILITIYHRRQLQVRGLDKKPKHIFSWLDGSVGFTLALLVAGSYALYVHKSGGTSFLDTFITPLLLLAIPLTPSAGLAHFLFWRVSHLSKYTLAVFGLACIIGGTLLQLHAPASAILNHVNPPKVNDTVHDGYMEFIVTRSYSCTPTWPKDSQAYCVDITVKNIDYSNSQSFLFLDQMLVGTAGRSFWVNSEDRSEPLWVNVPPGETRYVTLRFPYDGGYPRAIRLYGDELNETDGVEVKLR
jgi:MFS family permease